MKWTKTMKTSAEGDETDDQDGEEAPGGMCR